MLDLPAHVAGKMHIHWVFSVCRFLHYSCTVACCPLASSGDFSLHTSRISGTGTYAISGSEIDKSTITTRSRHEQASEKKFVWYNSSSWFQNNQSSVTHCKLIAICTYWIQQRTQLHCIWTSRSLVWQKCSHTCICSKEKCLFVVNSGLRTVYSWYMCTCSISVLLDGFLQFYFRVNQWIHLCQK